jgi:ribulose-bisphosphate carboxylase large chain
MNLPRFTVTYRISLYHDEDINSKIDNICREQSVELPRSVLSAEIERNIVGRLERMDRNSDATYIAKISYPTGNVSYETTQFLNVLFGNISLVSGIQVVDVDWNALPDGLLPGPGYGIDGVRERLGIYGRAMSCTALKPMGSTSKELAQMAFDFALGGIDLIKDDHGLTNQNYAAYSDRLQSCTNAINEANLKSGRNAVYIPHITGSCEKLYKRYEAAIDAGAGAVLICPQLCSPEAMKNLSAYDKALPIMAHPAFSGAYVQDPKHGFSKSFLYGGLWRALGADMVIFPNHAGRFSFTLDECDSIVNTSRSNELPFRKSFPTPGGGMQRDTLPRWISAYGMDTIFLIGGSLYQHPAGIRAAAEEIANALQNAEYAF